MGYTLTAVIVDPKTLRDALGSGDRGLFDRVLRMFPDDFDADDYDDDFDGITETEALKQLLDGDAEASPSGSSFGYAFEALAKALGEVAFDDRFDITEIDGGRYFDRTLPFPISCDDFPQLGWLHTDEVHEEFARLQSNGDQYNTDLSREWMSAIRPQPKGNTESC
ncbi:MAG: hypothetical protein ACE37I_05250 [Rubinisphaera brasiliensis]|uniref:DUF7691 family protein n=1 Tax=Rubinisphaera brasiliensis TaxID=119 RepID=UPI00391A4BCF